MRVSRTGIRNGVSYPGTFKQACVVDYVKSMKSKTKTIPMAKLARERNISACTLKQWLVDAMVIKSTKTTKVARKARKTPGACVSSVTTMADGSLYYQGKVFKQVV